MVSEPGGQKLVDRGSHIGDAACLWQVSVVKEAGILGFVLERLQGLGQDGCRMLGRLIVAYGLEIAKLRGNVTDVVGMVV